VPNPNAKKPQNLNHTSQTIYPTLRTLRAGCSGCAAAVAGRDFRGWRLMKKGKKKSPEPQPGSRDPGEE